MVVRSVFLCALLAMTPAVADTAQAPSAPAPEVSLEARPSARPMMGGQGAGGAQMCPCMMMGGMGHGGGAALGMILAALVGVLGVTALTLLVILEVVWIRIGLRRLRQQPQTA
jgi:hypothetical protein